MEVIPIKRAFARRAAPEPRTETFVASDGASIYYEDSGGDGPVLFYVYGLGCTIQHWKYSRSFFSDAGLRRDGRTYRQIWLEFRGQGLSERPRPGVRLTMRRIAQDIGELCEHLGVARATCLGQSLGGTIALRVAQFFPDLVSSLVLLGAPASDPGAKLPLQPILPALWKVGTWLNQMSPAPFKLWHGLLQKSAKADTLNFQKIPGLMLLLREIVRHQGFNPKLAATEDIEQYIENILHVPSDLFFDLAFDLMQYDIERVANEIKCPVLVLAGEADRIIPVEEARRLATVLPDATLKILPHGSHCPHIDDPSTVNNEIFNFLRKHGL